MDLSKYGPYRTPDEIYEHFRGLMKSAPGCEELRLGETWKGRPLLAWGFGAGEGKPCVMYSAGCHAIEFISTEQCAAVAEELVLRRRELLDKASVWFFPVFNPDGHYRVRDLLRRRLIPLVKTNARRVDLNRNFPVGFYEPHKGGIMAGSHRKIINYHGPEPLSEPESRALVKLVDHSLPSIALSLHSFGEKICFPPCHNKNKAPDCDLLLSMGAEMSRRQQKPYRVMAENDMYLTYGDVSDWLYEERGVLSFLMEIGPLGMTSAPPQSWYNIFMWTNPPDAGATVRNNTDACIYLIEAAIAGVRKGGSPTTIV